MTKEFTLAKATLDRDDSPIMLDDGLFGQQNPMFGELATIWAEALETGNYSPSNDYAVMRAATEGLSYIPIIGYNSRMMWDIECHFYGIDNTKDIVSIAMNNGLEEMLDAYFAGVSIEDIVPDRRVYVPGTSPADLKWSVSTQF